MVYCGKSDIGKKRRVNEDSFYTGVINNVLLCVVSDGMGGANGGSVASSLAVRGVVSTFEELSAASQDYSCILMTAVARANDAIYSMSREDEALSGMGTTIVACVVTKEDVLAVNVGDSRLYIAGRSGMRQVTKDHSLLQTLLDSGRLSPSEVDSYPNKNIITRALGIDIEVDADFFEQKHEGRQILMCSDGLYNFLKNDKIHEIIMSNEPDKALELLIDQANEAGGGDNITAVLIKP